MSVIELVENLAGSREVRTFEKLTQFSVMCAPA